MRLILSPAKTFKPELFPDFPEYHTPLFMDKTQELVKTMQQKSPTELANIMHISEKLADLNVGRFQNFPSKFSIKTEKQAIFSFYGDAYRGLEANTLSREDLLFCDKHLRILSGLYGLLRPLDLITPYRLEMGTKTPFGEYKNGYDYWKEILTKTLKKELNGATLINLASKEYFSALDFTKLNAPVITPVFQQFKNGNYKTIAILAKRARGQMVRFIVKNRINTPKDITSFQVDDYRFIPEASDDSHWVFQKG